MYRLTSADGSNIPAGWVIEFSDPVMGNKYGVESIFLEIPGRTCSNGGLVTSQHDRRFIWSGDQYLLDDAWGKHGACVFESQPDDNSLVDCSQDIEGTMRFKKNCICLSILISNQT